MSVKNPMAVIAELQKKLEAAEARVARSVKKPGWYDKTDKLKPSKEGRTGRFSADRVLPGGVVVSFYVGHLGKLAVSSGYKSGGLAFWANESPAVQEYLAGTGDGPSFADDLAKIPRGDGGHADG